MTKLLDNVFAVGETRMEDELAAEIVGVGVVPSDAGPRQCPIGTVTTFGQHYVVRVGAYTSKQAFLDAIKDKVSQKRYEWCQTVLRAPYYQVLEDVTEQFVAQFVEEVAAICRKQGWFVFGNTRYQYTAGQVIPPKHGVAIGTLYVPVAMRCLGPATAQEWAAQSALMGITFDYAGFQNAYKVELI